MELHERLKLARENAGYRFSPASPDLCEMVDRVEEAYSKYRVRVIELIYSRRDTLRSFSDAFRITKGPENHG